MTIYSNEYITEKKGRVVLLHGSTPASLEISGADVEGYAPDYVFAIGSVLVTPDKNYIAFQDGVFTEKSGGGGGGGDDDTSNKVGTGKVGYMKI